MILLITGGARSGKSSYGEGRVSALPGRPCYIATAEVRDDEMAERIAAHRARRGREWREREAPLDLLAALEETDGTGPRLVDCVTLWLTNLVLADRDWRAELAALTAALPGQKSPVIFVTNEVGMGIVPDNALARAFRDAAGHVNQALATAADEVQFVVSGLPLKVKG